MSGLITRVLGSTHEVSLKGGNRSWFEGKMVASVRRVLAGFPLAAVHRPSSRVLVVFSEPVPAAAVLPRMGAVFGLRTLQPVTHAGATLDEAEASVTGLLAGASPASFAVRCTRSDKRFPLTSLDIERELGRRIQARTGWPVRLDHPELTVHVLVDRLGFSVWTRRYQGPGGLPTGTGGRGLCLLSGGIDSPAAAYLMMKRGMRLDFVHFHSYPRTDPASLDKAARLTEIMACFQGPCRLTLVPLLDIQEAIVARCPEALRILLYRRFMVRLAERVAVMARSKCLVTGESLGQVASQTIENMAAVEALATRPVLRPLVGLDKEEIVAIAQRAGTFAVSILPHFDCCSFLQPERPATRSTADELAAAEAELDVPGLTAAALAGRELRRLGHQPEWASIPPPPLAGS